MTRMCSVCQKDDAGSMDNINAVADMTFLIRDPKSQQRIRICGQCALDRDIVISHAQVRRHWVAEQ